MTIRGFAQRLTIAIIAWGSATAFATCLDPDNAKCAHYRHQLEERIQTLSAEMNAAKKAEDWSSASRAGLRANRLREELFALDDPSRAPIDLDAKYAALAAQLEDDAARGDETSVSPLVYHPKELEAVLAVIHDFGEIYISTTPMPDGSDVRVPMPWSGYWYPRRSEDMFGSATSPLAKLEQVAKAAGREVKIIDWERERTRTFFSDSWEGMCGSWAMASTTSSEPVAVRSYQGVEFSIADQKALLTKSREAFPNKIYGVRYNGDVDTDGTFQDLRPEAFHALFTHVVGEQKRPLIVDEDPGIEVWSKPIYRVRWQATKDEEKPNAIRVKAHVWMVKERSAETAEPTTNANRTAVMYEYRLYVDPAALPDGRFHVIAGEWLNTSRRVHPDMAILTDPAGAWTSSNPEMNKVMDLVKAIVTP